MTAPDSLESVFKAYDVRGTVPDQLNPRRAYAIGSGFARFVAASERRTPGRDLHLLIGRDMRASGVELAQAFIAGATASGASVTDLGLCSTDMLYFATGRLSAPGTMLTASHNPANYNGMKFCLTNASPVGEESGLKDILGYAEDVLEGAPEHPEPVEVSHEDLLDAFASHVRSFIDPARLRPLRIVADTANGMGGLVVPRVFDGLPFVVDLLFAELDGNFPNHPADPIQPENLIDLQHRMATIGADVGLAFDGDADRVFLVDELGVPLSGSTTTAIVAKAMLDKHPGSTVLYNCICSKAVAEVIAESGGEGIRTRVGHSFIKGVMAETNAVFGGEHSGHYYFRDNYRADSGIIAALVVLELVSVAGLSLSMLRRPFERYSDSGELNSTVADPLAVIAAVSEHYRAEGAHLDFLDGLTADMGSWWFNLRPSNTEPLLRLNVEAADAAACARRVDEVVALLNSQTSRG